MKLKPGPGVTADLVAINIQRGRDHGLPPYVKFRDHFNVSKRSIPNELKSELINLYGDLDDVDLYVGGLQVPKCTKIFHCLCGVKKKLIQVRRCGVRCILFQMK